MPLSAKQLEFPVSDVLLQGWGGVGWGRACNLSELSSLRPTRLVLSPLRAEVGE